MSNEENKLEETQQATIKESKNIAENTESNESSTGEDIKSHELLENNSSIEEKEIHVDEGNKSKRGKVIIIISIVVILIIVGAIVYWWISNKSLVESYENKVYPEVYVESEPVGELKESELNSKLTDMENEIRDKKIAVKVGDNEYSVAYWEVDVTTNKDEIDSEVISYGKDEDFRGKLNLINKPEKKTYKLDIVVNEEKLKEFVSKIAEEVKIEPKNATAYVSGGSVVVEDGANGYALDEQAIIDSIKAGITAENGGADITVEGNLAEIEPEIKADVLKTIDTKVSSFTTTFSAGPSGSNIQTGAAYFNNTLLMPGEEFSCTDGIGPTTADRGFVSANTYVGGQVVPGMGGGVCQIATTLYNAELRAGILPTERQNHMMTVGYVGIGLDATLADDLIDLRFENTYDYPLIITTSTTSNSLTIEIWSNSNAKKGYTYEPRVEAVSSLHAYTYLDVYDSSGNLVDSIYLNESIYQPFS